MARFGIEQVVGGPVQLGQDDAGDPGGFLELLGLNQAVLSAQITESNRETASTDTSAPTDENVDTPQTSDSNNVYIYVACIIFALTGVIKYGKMKKVY